MNCIKYKFAKLIIIIIICLFNLVLFNCKKTSEVNTTLPNMVEEQELAYEADWESLGNHNASPIWFKNAKLGIYFHWGVYTVPAYHNEWYPRFMHLKDHDVYKHHVKKYGEPSEFGYHDFIPMFKAENFDPEAWADLFKKAGAQFAGPVAEHHDGFSMWDSDINPWNIVDKGPKRDISGELQKSIKARGMKFIATFHHSKQLQRSTKLNEVAYLSHFPYIEGMPPSSDDPELKILYGNMSPNEWYKIWYGKLKEFIDKYQPDIIWFDYVLGNIPEQYRKEFTAYYLNEAKKLKKEVVLVRKERDLPPSLSIQDIEQSRKNYISPRSWMTDATISDGSWCYTENIKVKPAIDILHMLIDITSKNGTLLLNVSPKADGTIPQNQQDELLKMGDWLSKYGEAIYASEPWYTFGEGPTKEPEGHFSNHSAFKKIKYSSKDIRYTIKNYNIYGIVMGATKPNEEIILKSFLEENIKDEVSIESIHFLGCDEDIEWSMTPFGLKIKAPSKTIDTMATAIKIKISS